MEFASICKENFGCLCFFQKGVWFLNFFKRGLLLIRTVFISEKSEAY